MKHIISILVQNHSGVLSRISGLFSRRGFNIDTLAVGVTENPDISRITIVVDGDEHTLEQVEKQAMKLYEVVALKKLKKSLCISRELMLVKVACNATTRGEILDIVGIMQAQVCDISPTTMTIEISDTFDRIEIALELLCPYNIQEIVRTGTIAVAKGEEMLKESI